MESIMMEGLRNSRSLVSLCMIQGNSGGYTDCIVLVNRGEGDCPTHAKSLDPSSPAVGIASTLQFQLTLQQILGFRIPVLLQLKLQLNCGLTNLGANPRLSDPSSPAVEIAIYLQF